MKLVCNENLFKKTNHGFFSYAKEKEAKLPLTVGKEYAVQIIMKNDPNSWSNGMSQFNSNIVQCAALLVFTDNKKWEEINSNTILAKGSLDVNDLLSRVFDDPN